MDGDQEPYFRYLARCRLLRKYGGVPYGYGDEKLAEQEENEMVELIKEEISGHD